MSAPRFSVPPQPLTVIHGGLVALQAQLIAAGELTIARIVGEAVDHLERRLAGSREAA